MPRNRHSQIKKDVGEFIISEMLLALSDGKSPVSGHKFKKLNKQYASEMKDGDTTPNLELEGDLLDALISKNRAGDKIEVGVFKKKEQGKADGHNNFSGNSNLPTRRFIPNESEKFKRHINNGIKQIISDAKEIRQPEQDISIIPLEQNIFDINLEEVLGRSFFDEFEL